MAVQVISDLHLEVPRTYAYFEIVPKAPFLALLGSIGNIAPHKDDCLAFLRRQLQQFRAVLFVPGNHDAYQSSWTQTLDILSAFQEDVREDSSLGEFVLLHRAVFRIPDTQVTILGCSLFSFIPQAYHADVGSRLNDFVQISDWDVDAHNEAHRKDVIWLNEQVAQLEQSDVEILILSHWCPSTDSRALNLRYVYPSTCGFATDLHQEKCFKSSKVKAWAFGHTHCNCDFEVEREDGAAPLRLVSNQRGHAFAEIEGFDREKIIRV